MEVIKMPCKKHYTESGRKYHMERKKGGGTKRVYDEPQTRLVKSRRKKKKG
jgi:hypothetical protein